jgi:hypothetical protein
VTPYHTDHFSDRLLERFQASIDVFIAPRTMPLLQVHGEVGVAQLRDEIFRHYDPLAHAWAVDHVVGSTVSERGILVFTGHGRTSAVMRDALVIEWQRPIHRSL